MKLQTDYFIEIFLINFHLFPVRQIKNAHRIYLLPMSDHWRKRIRWAYRFSGIVLSGKNTLDNGNGNQDNSQQATNDQSLKKDIRGLADHKLVGVNRFAGRPIARRRVDKNDNILGDL